MGGMGSGRSGGRPIVENAYPLSLYKMIRGATERAGALVNGSRWENPYSGEVLAEVYVILRMDQELPFATLLRRRDGKTIAEQRVELTTSVQPLGGKRWWFVCPITGERAASLCLPLGATRYASAAAYRLAYRSQRSTDRDRAIQRVHKMRRKLGADVSPLTPIHKPPRMRWETFDRKVAAIHAANGQVSTLSLPIIEALQRRVGRRLL